MSNIKKGYALALTTWENDGDNYKTVTKYGLSEQETKMYISLINGYKAHGDPNRWDECVTDEQVFLILDSTFPEHELPIAVSSGEYSSLDGWFEDEFLFEFGIYSEQWLRAIDSFAVFYYPADIEDVTNQFK